jgi:2-oxoglutarate dehydrogenase E2 component (dihydrolipoamide succinyltransferase)
MAVELVVPAVGESITEVQIGDWLVPEGSSANKEDALVVIETDKVTVELPAPVSGTVTKVLKKKGETAAVGEVIGYIDESVKGKSAAPKSPNETVKSAPAKAAPASGTPTPPLSPKSGASSSPTKRVDEPRVMPAAARALAQAGFTARDVEATGPGARMLKEDVQRRIEAGAKPLAMPSAPAAPTPPPAAVAPTAPAASTQPRATSVGNREEEVVPLTPLRKRIAERLVEAQNTAALLTTFNEIDMTAVIALRNEHKETFQARHGVKLGFMSFFVKAAIDALKLVPQLNAEMRGD